MDFSKLRELGTQLASQASASGTAQASQWTEAAVRAAVDSALNVIEIAAEEAAKRTIQGRSIDLTASISIGVIQLAISVNTDAAQLNSQDETAAGQ